MPAMFNPSAPLTAPASEPVRLSIEDSILFDGGIRVVRADRSIPAPPFDFRGEEGRTYSNESLAGRVVWMNLWATWCATCRAEFPDIQRIHENLVNDGLTTLSVCRNSTREDFEAAVRKDWISFPVVDASRVAPFPIPYGAFPTNLLIDRAGRVRAYWQGHRSLKAVEKLIGRLLLESGDESLPISVRPYADSLPEPRESESVVSAELSLPREELSPGQLLEGTIIFDLAPGWHLTASEQGGSIPVEVRFEAVTEIASLDCHLPSPEWLVLAGASREVYSGRVELPVWGVVRPDVVDTSPVEIAVLATIQACDETSCLVPSEIRLSGEVCLADSRQ